MQSPHHASVWPRTVYLAIAVEQAIKTVKTMAIGNHNEKSQQQIIENMRGNQILSAYLYRRTAFAQLQHTIM